ncbi:MAG: enoyl-CoA hydratase/isomerase family protein, partial [Pseudomonadota bacterium]
MTAPPAPLHLRSEHDGRVLVLTLDHGKANEVGQAWIAGLADLVARLEAGEARALVTTSARVTAGGHPVFSAGADVVERHGWEEARVLAHVHTQREVMGRLARAPVLHLCVVDGLALGWGLELCLCADYLLVGPQARFGLPETGLGIVPGAGGTAHLAHRVGTAQALRLGMAGELIDAAEALRIGLAHEACESGVAGLVRALGLAQRVAGRSPTAVAAFKAA